MAKPHILVVDSDEGFGNMLKDGLNNSGYYQARCVHTGREAWKSLMNTSFDLVIVDMGLTDISSISFVRAIQKAKNGIRVMMIPLIGQQLPDRVKALNINGVLTKPFFVGDLPDLIDQAIGRQRAAAPPLAASAPPTRVAPRKAMPASTSNKAQKETQTATPTMPAPATSAIPYEKVRFIRANKNEILQLLNDLNREVRAEAILFIVGGELIAEAGLLTPDQCQELAVLVAQSSQAAAQAANFLGEKAGRFAQSSHEGSEYRVYTLTLGEGILLSLAVSSNIPLGMIRHQCRQIAEQLSRFI